MTTKFQGVHRTYTMDDINEIGRRTKDPDIRAIMGEFQRLIVMHAETQKLGVFAGKPNAIIGKIFPRLKSLNMPDQLMRLAEEISWERSESSEKIETLKRRLRETIDEAIDDANFYKDAMDLADQVIADHAAEVNKLHNIITALYVTLTLYVIALIAYAH